MAKSLAGAKARFKPKKPSVLDAARAKFGPIAKKRGQQNALAQRRKELPAVKAAVTAKVRGKSASAPGHNKPPGSKRAIGRGQLKKPDIRVDPRESAGFKPPTGGAGSPAVRPRKSGPGTSFRPPTGRTPMPKPVDPGMPIMGPTPRRAGSGPGTSFRPPVVSRPRTSPNPSYKPGTRPSPSNLEKFPQIRAADRSPGSGTTSTSSGPRVMPIGRLPAPSSPGKSGLAPGHNKPIGSKRAVPGPVGVPSLNVGATPGSREGRFSPTGLPPGAAMRRSGLGGSAMGTLKERFTGAKGQGGARKAPPPTPYRTG